METLNTRPGRKPRARKKAKAETKMGRNPFLAKADRETTEVAMDRPTLHSRAARGLTTGEPEEPVSSVHLESGINSAFRESPESAPGLTRELPASGSDRIARLLFVDVPAEAVLLGVKVWMFVRNA